MDDIFYCENCGSAFSSEERCYFDEQILCSHCLDERTVVCSRCGDRIWKESNAGDDNISLCQSCYDRFYTSCENCGRIISDDTTYYAGECDEEALCWNCYQRHQRKKEIIKDYSFKPDPIFHGEGPRFFGVELEVDRGGESESKAMRLLEEANINGWEYLYIKHDGSLDDGFELVTHPMSLDYHMEVMPWEDVLREAVSTGYRSHQTSTCGLHVHVSLEALGRTEEEQERVIARMLYFMEKHWEELLKFSRRTSRQLERWAKRYGLKEQPGEILDHAKKGYHSGRYSSLNLENEATVEFRIFRGTLKLNILLATLQMVDQICDVALYMSDEEVKAMAWTTFVSGCTQPALVQ